MIFHPAGGRFQEFGKALPSAHSLVPPRFRIGRPGIHVDLTAREVHLDEKISHLLLPATGT